MCLNLQKFGLGNMQQHELMGKKWTIQKPGYLEGKRKYQIPIQINQGPTLEKKTFEHQKKTKNKKQEYIIGKELLTQSSKNTKHHVSSKVQM